MLALILALLTSGVLPLDTGGGAPGLVASPTVVASPADTGGGAPG